MGSYLRYLSRVWPDNRLAEPPGQGVSQGARWTNPYLGLEMVRIEPIEGRPFWISTKPLLEFLRGQRLVDVPLPESPTRQQAVDLAASVSASLPTQAEYRAWVGALNPRFDSRRRYWAERSESGGRDPAVEIGTSVTSLSKRSGYRLKDGDFYLVVR